MVKGQIYGPYTDSVADRAIRLIKIGVTDRYRISQGLGLTPMEVRHRLRHLVGRGVLAFEREQYKLTEFGAQVLEETA